MAKAPGLAAVYGFPSARFTGMGLVCPNTASSAKVMKLGFTGESARSMRTFRPTVPRSAVVPHGFAAAVPARKT